MAADQVSHFIFEHAQGWYLHCFVVVALVASWWSWRRYGPRPDSWWGILARCCRVAAVLVIIAAMMGPAWRTVSTTVIPGRLLILVDRSASMAREDGPQGSPRIAQAAALYHALSEEQERLQASIEWRSIGGLSGTLDPADGVSLTAMGARGERSPLGHEIEQAARSQHADLMVVVSDFRITEGTTLEVAADALRRLDVSAWALGVGGTAIDAELMVEDVSGNTTVALGERQPFTLRMSGRALDGTLPLRIQVRDGERSIIDREIAPDQIPEGDDVFHLEERLELVLDREGTRELTFQVSQGELSSSLQRQVEVSTRRLQVLMLAHRPRYEMRYLQVALARDHTVDVHAYLADGRWRRWSAAGPAELPFRLNELRDYDVIILGDISPSMLTAEAQSAIISHVREGGAGLVWIPGETGATALFHNQDLGSLLPVVLPSADELARSYSEDSAIVVRTTEIARDAAFLDAGDRDWDSLPRLRRIGAVERVRDLARVWMEDEHERPVVVSAPFGNGQSVIITVDDTWRWRRNVGDVFLHRFHSQILRFASRARASGSRRWRIDAVPYRATPGQEVALSILPLGAHDDGQSLPSTVTVEWSREDGERRLQQLQRVVAGHGYRASDHAPALGAWRISMVDGLIPAEVSPGFLTVMQPSDETRDPRFDEAAMRALVEGTGGRGFREPQQLAQALPVLSRQQQQTHLDSLWDRWWWMVALVLLLSVEWSIRRLSRLP